ncbi:MAG: NAD(P)/FAD-dependent oxidoreductase [Lachnospiraceae bacterium]|nr:NAD(P)/FAD-dependent oxidoreductase [Lachnospiraceae bacterium]
MTDFDVIVIGTGISGACIARELTRWRLSVGVLEKGYDLCCGATKGNSATVHSGHDADHNTLKGKYNVLGNAMYDQLCRELSVPFRRNGTIIFAASPAEETELVRLKANADKGGVPGVRILTRAEMDAMEGTWGSDVRGGLYAPTGGVVCPYTLTFALCENAARNGAEFFTNREVTDIRREGGRFIVTTPAETYRCRYVFNCAGTHADDMNNFVSRHKITIIPRKGSHIILDKRLDPYVRATLVQTPSPLPGGGHTKGQGIQPTMDRTVIIGCEARDVADKDDMATTPEGLDDVLSYFRKNWHLFPISRFYPSFPQDLVIGAFAGIRPHPTTDDYILGEPEDCPGFFNMAGIESPGITAAPAIAADLVGLAAARYGFEPNEAFDPIRRVRKPFRDMSADERAAAIAEDPDYATIICRCEQITKAEILEAIRRPLGARSVNSVKMRVRAGMGRCQGGFCSPEVVRILSEELGIPMTEVLQSGSGSNVLPYEAGIEEGLS